MGNFFVLDENEIICALKKISDATDDIISEGKLLFNKLESITEESIKDVLITNKIDQLKSQIALLMFELQNSQGELSSEVEALITDVEQNDNYR